MVRQGKKRERFERDDRKKKEKKKRKERSWRVGVIFSLSFLETIERGDFSKGTPS